jgi:hypothetical protein
MFRHLTFADFTGHVTKLKSLLTPVGLRGHTAQGQGSKTPVTVHWSTWFFCFCACQQCTVKVCWQQAVLEQGERVHYKSEEWMNIKSGTFIQFLLSQSDLQRNRDVWPISLPIIIILLAKHKLYIALCSSCSSDRTSVLESFCISPNNQSYRPV